MKHRPAQSHRAKTQNTYQHLESLLHRMPQNTSESDQQSLVFSEDEWEDCVDAEDKGLEPKNRDKRKSKKLRNKMFKRQRSEMRSYGYNSLMDAVNYTVQSVFAAFHPESIGQHFEGFATESKFTQECIKNIFKQTYEYGTKNALRQINLTFTQGGVQSKLDIVDSVNFHTELAEALGEEEEVFATPQQVKEERGYESIQRSLKSFSKSHIQALKEGTSAVRQKAQLRRIEREEEAMRQRMQGKRNQRQEEINPNSSYSYSNLKID